MEKISRILPNNNRFPSQELNLSNPRWGASELDSSRTQSGRNVLKSSRGPALEAHRELSGWRAKEARHSDIVEKVQKQFFSLPEPEVKVDMSSYEIPNDWTESFLNPVAQESSPVLVLEDQIGQERYSAPLEPQDSGAWAEEAEDYSLYPKGSFIDVEV